MPEGDAFTPLLVGGDLNLVGDSNLASIRCGLIDGEVHVLELGPNVEDIVGVAVWFPPGKDMYSS